MNMSPGTANRRILVIDDHEAIHQDFRKILGPEEERAASLAASEAALFGEAPPQRQGFELDSAYQGGEGLAMVVSALAESRPYALAFVDMRMPPGWDGVETIERLWQVDAQLQIALCTAYSDYSWEALSKRLDLSDRLLILKKPFDTIEIRQMASALTMKWQMMHDAALKTSHLEKTIQTSKLDLLRLSHMVKHNVLTDLPNHILLHHRLPQAIALSERHRKQLAVICVGVDNLERINNALGYGVGDEVLRSVARRLVANVRMSDPVFHRGGSEFIVVLEDVTHPEKTVSLAEKLLAALSKPDRIAEHDLQISVSLGISLYPNDGDDGETLIRNAETAMRNVKEGGGFCFFEPSMDIRARERQSMVSNLHRALDQRELLLHYQPKVNLASGVITGGEALVRWPIADLGFVPPAQFIPIAEDCGLILSLGRWARREACRQVRSWHDSGFPSLSMAVNVSVSEFRDERFLEGVREALIETGLEPHLLELEITESILIKDIAATTALLRGLKDLGVKIAVDDFGTGYSSLSYLKRLPVDTLKIDQSFVRGVTTVAEDAAIVSAVINLGKSLGLRVVAEGVETSEQRAFLQAHGCEEGQGYYFSEAIAAEAFARLLTSGIS
ncbi:GGDEF and EAL domain-containing protein [Paraburkholderia phytofirmans]|uniref:Diguanylate cyclase n=1 Tax=Paraburkholderia phytofirmans OLGA172 TaxID=1417228 RepID=A0A161I6Q4_9BURK|nr:GGDEF and EAL domain-containing protein [Paraburkholderia phytofirmans]ANB73053.1 diguanylate cyclase [Paraburkholderia phytofirmans OLGA172]